MNVSWGHLGIAEFESNRILSMRTYTSKEAAASIRAISPTVPLLLIVEFELKRQRLTSIDAGVTC